MAELVNNIQLWFIVSLLNDLYEQKDCSIAIDTSKLTKEQLKTIEIFKENIDKEGYLTLYMNPGDIRHLKINKNTISFHTTKLSNGLGTTVEVPYLSFMKEATAVEKAIGWNLFSVWIS